MKKLIIGQHTVWAKKWDTDEATALPLLSDCFYYLHNEVELLSGVTLERIIEIVCQNLYLYEIVLTPIIPIREIIEEIGDIPKEDFQYLLLERFAEQFNDEFEDSIGFYAIGQYGQRYNVSFSPLYNLKHLELKMCNQYTLWKHDTKNFRGQEIALGNKSITWLELLYAIFWELSWNGTPEQRNKELKKWDDLWDEAT